MMNLNPEIAKALGEGMRNEGGIELPFPTPVLYAINGQPAYRGANNAQYYGGWATDYDKLDDVLGLTDRAFPLTFVQAEATTRDTNKSYQIACTRVVLVAPIGKRQSWISKEGTNRASHYLAGYRQHLQVLAYLAQREDEKTLRAWGPVTLSAKGYQAGKILQAFKEWDSRSATPRKKYTLPANVFWLPIGTFGERVTEKVGKGNLTSPITPVAAFLPKEVDDDYLTKMFVGETIALEMHGLYLQAKSWLEAWNADALKGIAPAEEGEPEQPPEENWS